MSRNAENYVENIGAQECSTYIYYQHAIIDLRDVETLGWGDM